jgi:23S rRNA (cytosine1962-C5)-methyltransferase
MSEGKDRFEESLENLLRIRIENALKLRTQLLLLPNSQTTVYRLLNGEGDGVSGLVVDVMEGTVVIQSSAYWTELHRKCIENQLRNVLKTSEVIKTPKLIWTKMANRLISDGWQEPPLPPLTVSAVSPLVAKDFQESQDQEPAEDSSPMIVKENGIRFHVTPGQGQKTGFYCDQRENRDLIRTLSKGRPTLLSHLSSSLSSPDRAQGEMSWISIRVAEDSQSML